MEKKCRLSLGKHILDSVKSIKLDFASIKSDKLIDGSLRVGLLIKTQHGEVSITLTLVFITKRSALSVSVE